MFARIRGGFGPMDVAAIREHVTLEFLKITIEVIDRFPFDQGGVRTRILPIGVPGLALATDAL